MTNARSTRERTDEPLRLADFLRPDGVALIGGIDRRRSAAQLRAELDPRYGSRWYLVSPNGGEVDGITVYRTIGEVPEPVDLAVIRTPAAAAPEVVRACGRAGVRDVAVFASGFAETGPQGAALQTDLRDAVAEAGVRLLGPNTNLNVFEPQHIPDRPFPVAAAVLSQSGFQGRAVTNAQRHNLRVVREVALGNEVDLTAADFLMHYADDPDIGVVAVYAEGFHDGDALQVALARCAATDTAVVVLKAGRTEAGRQMAMAHTAHRAGDDHLIDGIFDRYGVIRVDDLDELRETTALLAGLPRDTGPRAVLYSVSGGTCTHMADQAAMAGVPVPTLAPSTQEHLHRLIPRYLTVSNPVDNGGAFVMASEVDDRRAALTAMAEDPEIDLIVVGLPAASTLTTDNMARDVAAAAEELAVPIVAVWADPTTDEVGFRALVEARVPVFRSFRGCFRALVRHERRRRVMATQRVRSGVASTSVHAALAAIDDGSIAPATAAGLLASTGLIGALPPFDPPDPTEGIEITVTAVEDPDLGTALIARSGGPIADLLDDAVAVPLPLDAADLVAAFGRLAMARRATEPALVALAEPALAFAALIEAVGPRLGEAELALALSATGDLTGTTTLRLTHPQEPTP